MFRHLVNIKAFLRKTYDRFVKIRGNPREIALGFALGLFVGMSPAIGLHTVIAVFLAALVKWNKITAAIGVWITNPVLAPFIYSMNYFVGMRFYQAGNADNISHQFELSSLISLLHEAPEFFWTLTIGGVITGIPVAIAGYFLLYTLIVRYRLRLKDKILRKRAKRAAKKVGALYRTGTTANKK